MSTIRSRRRQGGQQTKQSEGSTLPPRRSSRLSLARQENSRREERPFLTRLSHEDEAGDMISDHDGSSFSSSASPSLSPSLTRAHSSFANASSITTSRCHVRKSSLKDSLGLDWTTKSCHRYWPAEGWSSATSNGTQIELQGNSSAKRGRVEWKGLPCQNVDNVQDSPTILASRKGEEGSKRTRSGRMIKKVERNYPGGIVKKRTRSDPLPQKRRATTPPSTSHLSVGNPDRPQSAMKHRSANQYSLGKREDHIVVTSHCQMPEADSSPGHSPFVVVSTSAQKVICKPRWSAPALNVEETAEMDEADPDAFSPLASKTQKQLATYILKVRPSLPKSDFYERHKEEEGSPTPESRRRDSIPVT